MTQPSWSAASSNAALDRPRAAGLADVLELVLDKGVVIAGDIKINLLEIELLTIKLRLLICSVDRAREMGIDWWESDPTLTTAKSGSDEQGGGSGQGELARRIEELERRVGAGGSEDER